MISSQFALPIASRPLAALAKVWKFLTITVLRRARASGLFTRASSCSLAYQALFFSSSSA
jgi:hypothetical protein